MLRPKMDVLMPDSPSIRSVSMLELAKACHRSWKVELAIPPRLLRMPRKALLAAGYLARISVIEEEGGGKKGTMLEQRPKFINLPTLPN